MVSLTRKKYSPIGLDLGRTAIRGVQLLTHGQSVHVHTALELTCDDELIYEPIIDTDTEDPQTQDQDNQTKPPDQLKRLIDQGGFVGRDVVLHCPADKLDLRPIEIPAGPEGLPREAILGVLRLKIADYLPFPVEQAVFDYFLMSHDIDRGHLTVMAISAHSTWIETRIKMVESIGLCCVAVDALPCALARLTTDQKTEPSNDENESEEENAPRRGNVLTAMLDIGLSGSTLIVQNDRHPLFCRRFHLGGSQLTDALAQRLALEFKQAERLKLAYGLDSRSRRLRTGDDAQTTDNSNDTDSDEIAKTIYAALGPDLNEYVEGLLRSLNYVIAEHNGAGLNKIVLCGSAGHTRNLNQFLQSQFNVPVEIVSHPLLTEISDQLPRTRAQQGSWATALSLAMTSEAI